METKSELAQQAVQALKKDFNVKDKSIKVVQAPGRVNLIGGHTDYNDGFVLPVAIDRQLVIAGVPRSDNQVQAYSIDFESRKTFNLSKIHFNEETQWINYLQGVANVLQQAGYNVPGMDLALTGTIPLGAGLSSSAALEVATALISSVIGDFNLDKVEIAKLCRTAENEFVGVNCGIMDQFISALGEENQGLFIDCRSYDYQLIPINQDDLKIVVSNTNVEHNLVDSAYNQRLKECQQGVEVLNQNLSRPITALRDVTKEEWAANKGALASPVKERVEHVVEENNRVLKASEALQNDNFQLAGSLITDSHQSLRDLYEVSCDELDLLVDLALEIEGVYGSRMTGAGFGGCTVSLVETAAVEEFKTHVYEQYADQTGIEPDIYVCDIETGAEDITKLFNPLL